VIGTGYFSKNKYSLLGSVRCAILTLNLEIFLGLVFISLVVLSESFSFSAFVVYQEVFWFFFIFFGLSGLILMVFLLETNRAPFDLPEAESELVSGYNTEYGSFLFALYYLGEYFHLFFFSLNISLLLFGG
jgi:NADH-quinone oxidoreductase subunit H